MNTKKIKKPATAEYCLDKVIADEMDWIIEIMSKENPSVPFVSHDPQVEAKFKRKMIKAAKRIKSWYTVPTPHDYD